MISFGMVYDPDEVLAATPVGIACLFCGEAIVEGDIGEITPAVHADGSVTHEPEHRECQLRNVLGGIEHLTAGPHRAGDCYKGSTLTYRQSALAGWRWVQEHGAASGVRVALPPLVPDGD